MEDRARWAAAERTLWAAFMYPRRRKVSLHGLDRVRRAKLRETLEKIREREFADEWRAYHDWLAH